MGRGTLVFSAQCHFKKLSSKVATPILQSTLASRASIKISTRKAFWPATSYSVLIRGTEQQKLSRDSCSLQQLFTLLGHGLLLQGELQGSITMESFCARQKSFQMKDQKSIPLPCSPTATQGLSTREHQELAGGNKLFVSHEAQLLSISQLRE